jgi:D-3-phosphoglycerate dehydrogenase
MWPLRTLESTTFGLVGFGRIARVVASRMRAFGSEVVVHDPFVLETAIVGAGARPAGWQELWERAHIVSLHVPLTSDTKGLVDRDAFDCMQPGSYLVNTSRGGLVVRTALEHALEAGVLAGVGLDVWWSEPPDPEDPLLRDPRVLVTPHIAYLSAESMPRLRRLAVERLIARIRE